MSAMVTMEPSLDILVVADSNKVKKEPKEKDGVYVNHGALSVMAKELPAPLEVQNVSHCFFVF